MFGSRYSKHSSRTIHAALELRCKCCATPCINRCSTYFHCDAPITRVGVMYSTWSTLHLGANPFKSTVYLIARYIQAIAPCRSNRCSLVGTGVPPQVEKPISKPELLNNEEGTQHNKTVLFRKALARRDDSNAAIGTLILSAVVFSGVENSVQGGVISHVTYCCIRLNKTNL